MDLEAQRLAQIAKNKAMLESLGLSQIVEDIRTESTPEKKPTRPYKKKPPPPPAVNKITLNNIKKKKNSLT
jgi:hypothetical protein